MKKLFLLFTSLLLSISAFSQLKTAAGYGIGIIRLGTPQSKVLTLFEKNPVLGYFSRKQYDDLIKAGEMSQEDYNEALKSADPSEMRLKVKAAGEYTKYYGRTVAFIEVGFDENNNVSAIDIFVEKSGDNDTHIWGEFNKVLGEQPCATPEMVDPETGETINSGFMCGWPDAPEVELFTWNGWGESIFNEYVYIRLDVSGHSDF